MSPITRTIWALPVLLIFALAMNAGAQPLITAEDVSELPDWLKRFRHWNTIEFHPNGDSIRGIPVKKLASDICKANELSIADYPERFRSEFSDKESLSISGRFSGGRRIQTALIGTYESCNGENGLFLLILEATKKSKRIRFFEKYENALVMSIQPAENNSLLVMWCVGGCDDGAFLRWDKSKGKFIWAGSLLSDDEPDAQPINPQGAAR
jgi:hypothetical protein